MKRYAFIYNPAAREGKSEPKIRALEHRIHSLSEANIFRSKAKGDISQLVSQLLNDYDVFVACGGDGTIREVASSLLNTDKTMGIVPMGTGNDLCKTLKIPINLDESLEMIFEGTATKIDVGRCNDFIFLNTLGFGFNGLANRYAVELKNIHPFFRYAFAALKATLNQNKFSVQVYAEEESYQRPVIMTSVANGRVEGGAFWIAPDASVTDGKLNFVMVSPISKWLIPFLLPLALFKKADWIPHYHTAKVDKLTLKIEENVAIHADGEVIKKDKDKFTISLFPRQLEIICGL